MMVLLAHISASFKEAFPGRVSEWALSAMLTSWAAVLVLRPEIFTTQVYFAALNAILSQPTWAVLCLTVGCTRLFVLLVNGLLRRSPHLRALTAFLSALIWFEISIGFLQSGAPTTGLAIYPWLFILDTFNCVRAMGDAGQSDRIIADKRTTAHEQPPSV